jgi:transcription initiation factor TFIID subunit 5
MAKQLPSACMYTLSHAAERACCAALSGSGALLASGFADAQLRVWDMERGASERAKAAQAAPGAAPGVNGAPPQAVSRAAPAAAHLVLTGHAGPVYCCDFTPADDYLLSSGADGTVRLWSVALGGLPLMAYAGHAHPAWCVAAAPAGHYFASGSYDRTARVWALDAPHARRVLVGHAADVDTVAWHPGCSYLASGSADRTVRLWDVASGECVRVLAGLRAPPRSLAFSPDGRSLATGADDGTVALWDLASARCVAEAPGAHGGGVNSLAWSAEGALLASAGADATLQLWNPTAGGAVAAAVAGGAAAVLPCAKVLRSKGGQFLTARFTARNLLFAVGSR